MRLPASEKLEIIGLVEQSHLPARRTLQMLGIKRSTFYRWYDRYRSGGPEALEDKPPNPDRVWNRIPDAIRQRVVMMVFEQPEVSPRELATRFTDTNSYYVSESEMVRNLEERLGVRLVERTTRSVAPTAAGERLLERLRPVLDEYQSALESTNEFRGKPAGMLRVTAPPPAGDFFLASAIPRFLAHYPEISLDLSFTDALTDIVAERFDAGIRIGERIERDMIATVGVEIDE